MKVKKTLVVGLLLAASVVSQASGQLASDTVSVSAEVVQSALFVVVDMDTINFPQLEIPLSGTQRTISSTANLSWNAPIGENWHVEVSTDNALNQPGLVSSSGTEFILLKFNNAIIAPQGDINDGNTDWDNNWRFVFDPDNDTPLNFTSSELSADVGNTDFTFAVQLTDNTLPDTYSGVVTFDLVAGL